MYLSCFSDELCLDFPETLPILKSWGLEHVDLRNRVFGKTFSDLSVDEIKKVKGLLDDHGMKVGCLQSYLAKDHLPDADVRKSEAERLEKIISIADALDCHLARSFFFWQPGRKNHGRILPEEESGQLTEKKELLEQVVEYYRPLAERAQQAGLQLAFENCDVTPPEIFTFLDAMDMPNLSLAWDAWFWWDWVDGQGLTEDADATSESLILCAKRAGCVHAKGRGSIEAMMKDKEGRANPTVPYERVLATCKAVGLKGPVSLETGYHNYKGNAEITDQKESEDIIENSRQQVGVLKHAWPSAAGANVYKAARPKPPRLTRPWEKDPVRFVVVGLGMGHLRSRTVTETSGAKLVGVCDLQEDRAQNSGEAFGVPHELDVRRWLDNKDVEVIYVMTPTGRHLEVAKLAIEAGKHVLCTKPMEVTLEACEEMIKLADEKGVLLGIDFQMRYEQTSNTLKQAIEDGVFGTLLGGRVSLTTQRTDAYYQESGGWRGTKRWDGGGVMSNQAVHSADDMVYAIGLPTKVKSDVWTQTHDIEGEDLSMGVLYFEGGLALQYFATTSYTQKTWSPDLWLYGTDAAYSMTYGGILEKPDQKWFINNAWQDNPPKVVNSEWMNAVDNFSAAVRQGSPLSCDSRGGWRTQSVLDAMYRSAYNEGVWTERKTTFG